MLGVGTVTQAAIVAVAFLAGATQKTDFSGTWAAKQMAVDSAGGVTGGSVIRIEQNATAIRIRRTYGREALTNPPTILTITLDGRESPNPYNMVHRPGLTGAITSRAKWDGNRLIIVTTRTMTEATKKTYKTESTETFSFDGPRLVVDRVVVSPSGRTVHKDIWSKQ